MKHATAPDGSEMPPQTNGETPAPSGVYALALGSIGVVYGDIGTSPLYAFRVALTAAADSGPITRGTVLGVDRKSVV